MLFYLQSSAICARICNKHMNMQYSRNQSAIETSHTTMEAAIESDKQKDEY